MKKIKLPQLTCQRCGHKWIPRSQNPPRVCPNGKCKSPYWDKPRKEEKTQETSENNNHLPEKDNLSPESPNLVKKGA